MGEVISYSRPRTIPDRQAKREALAAFRKRLVERIEFMIELVDEIDGDPDFEPSLGWSKTMATGDTNDLEEDRLPTERTP
ncbi:hypothetical protein [Antarcticirhabdus aurantiaca]|uniref:Uncharacterized protein n=1 Tax=Antarcticirhabdus aurantiaca TaxID=2606717 RepID=A0ACD4NMR2_9HYPH|nr:hypothetical protein [Antarcticirhabdus aurantiaca]WAJ28042.1 hypothetical protein OXU80_24980 [Jeongeuplla avenae]